MLLGIWVPWLTVSVNQYFVLVNAEKKPSDVKLLVTVKQEGQEVELPKALMDLMEDLKRVMEDMRKISGRGEHYLSHEEVA